jgi:hypothetical protein
MAIRPSVRFVDAMVQQPEGVITVGVLRYAIALLIAEEPDAPA